MADSAPGTLTGRVVRRLRKRRTFRHKPHIHLLAITRTYCFHKRDAAGITTRARGTSLTMPVFTGYANIATAME